MSINLGQILQSLTDKAMEDNIITEDEQQLLHTVEFELNQLDQQIKEIVNASETKSVLERVITNTRKSLLNKVISSSRNDGRVTSDEKKIIRELVEALGYDVNATEERPWYVYKICVNIDLKQDMSTALNELDRVFCIRGIQSENVYSGLCLGTKHFMMEDRDVTLLVFALTPDTTQTWVKKGAFAIIDYNPKNFSRLLERTALDLVATGKTLNP